MRIGEGFECESALAIVKAELVPDCLFIFSKKSNTEISFQIDSDDELSNWSGQAINEKVRWLRHGGLNSPHSRGFSHVRTWWITKLNLRLG